MHDLTVWKILRDVGAHKGQIKMAERKLSTFGKMLYQHKHLNSAPRLMRMKSHYDLSSGLEAVVTAKRRVKAQAAAKNTGKWVKNLSRARRKIRGCTLNAGALKKLTVDELKGLVLTDLHVGQDSIPSGSKDKMVSVFLEKAAEANRNGPTGTEVWGGFQRRRDAA